MKINLSARILTYMLFIISGFSGSIYSVQLTGRVFSEADGRPLEFGTLIAPEARIKSRITADGSYRLTFPNPGRYAITVTSPGYNPYQFVIDLNNDEQRDIRLRLTSIRGATVKIRAERDIQKISRNTLNQNQIKDAPATFGDSINALTTLPGVIRPGVFLGPLIIRGASDRANRYFIDDIPVPNPQHFGGLQSIIGNDLIAEIDLYSSAFPAYYGSAYGAVIDIATIDEVKEFGGVIDVGIVSSNILLKAPWGKNVGGVNLIGTNDNSDQNQSAKNGYWIVAGRIGYLSVLVPPIYTLITGEELLSVPEYYDYQFKGKYFLDDKGNHALSFLSFGNYDTFRFIRNLSSEERERELLEDPTQDPDATRFSNDISSHSQGLYYDYIPSTKLYSRVIAYHTLTNSRFYARARKGPTAESGRGEVNVTNRPNIAGLKHKARLELIPEFFDIKTGLEVSHFYFSASGQAQQRISENFGGAGGSDRSTDVRYVTVPLNFSDSNTVLSFSADPRFTLNGLQIVPGARVDYLNRSGEVAIGPRGLVAYEFDFGTTLSAAGGLYHSFPQVNTFIFNQPFNQQPQVTIAEYLQSEKALHRTLGIAHNLENWEFKSEVFLNSFYDQIQPDSSQTNRFFANSASSQSRGMEFLIRKNGEDTEKGDFYGWLSYTYTEATRNLNGREIPFQFDQTNSLKLILGYKKGIHNFGSRFELYSGYPYTEIIGSTCVSDPCGGQLIEYAAIYNTANPYGARYPMAHRLDLRYTQTRDYSWGSFRWYIEVINVYNMRPVTRQVWDNTIPFAAGSNPRLRPPDFTLSLIPNFGLEWKF